MFARAYQCNVALNRRLSMTPSQELKHSKYVLIASQKAFAKHPSATNWQRVLFHMEHYQELFNTVSLGKEAHA